MWSKFKRRGAMRCYFLFITDCFLFAQVKSNIKEIFWSNSSFNKSMPMLLSLCLNNELKF